ncbi:MAG: ABC transporter permease, partial [Planctomycetes bacterium]|nr:ABC transporter permease [Planctomycetota bacterium]
MLQYIIRRLLVALPLLVAVFLGTFVLTKALPGDPVEIRIGKNATHEQAEALRHELGLNAPLHQQFSRYVVKAVHLDFGRNNRDASVSEEIATRLPATFELATFAMIIAITIGVSIG